MTDALTILLKRHVRVYSALPRLVVRHDYHGVNVHLGAHGIQERLRTIGRTERQVADVSDDVIKASLGRDVQRRNRSECSAA